MKTTDDCADVVLRLVCLMVLLVAGIAMGIKLERADQRRDNPCLYAVHSDTGEDAVIYREGKR